MLKTFLRKTKIIALAATVTLFAASIPTPAATLQTNPGFLMEESADDAEQVEVIEDGQVVSVATASDLALEKIPVTDNDVTSEGSILSERLFADGSVYLNDLAALRDKIKQVTGYSNLAEEYHNYCGAWVWRQLTVGGIGKSGSDIISTSYGKDFCNAQPEGRVTSGGYTVTRYSGSNALDTLLANQSQPIEHVVISFNGTSSNTAGHVVYIRAIDNNTVYFMDSYTYRGAWTACEPSSVSLSNFVKYELAAVGSSINSVVWYAKKQNVVKPKITKAEIVPMGSWGYEVKAYVTPGTYPISQVRFPTWTEANGQDDLAHGQENIPENWEVGGHVSGANVDYWFCDIYDEDHNYEKGKYITHVYAFDSQGNRSDNYAVSTTLTNKGEVQGTKTWNGHTYKIIADNLTWPQAKAACEKAGGHLATITSQEEQKIISDLICFYAENRPLYYLGGKIVNKKVQWITGESTNYTNWASGQPDNWGNAEDALAAYSAYETNTISGPCGEWVDYISNGLNCGYILEIDPPATKLTTQPTNQTVNLGSTAKFTVKASGENLTYQWQVSDNGTTWNNSGLTGNKTATLSVVGASANHGSKYRCVVTGSGGSVTSNAVSLTVAVDAPELKAIFSSHDGVNFVWNAVEGVSKYRVYRKVGTGSYTKLLDTTETAILDSAVTSGTKYTYTVQCLSDSNLGMGGKDEAGMTKTYLDTPVVNVPTSAAAGVRVSWPTVKGAAKYVILRHIGPGQPTWKWIKTVTAGADATQVYVDSSAEIKSGTWYAYTIRAMAEDGSYSGQVGGRAIRWLAPVQTKSIVRANPGVKVYFNNVPGGYAYCLYRSEKGSDGKFEEYVKIKQTIKVYNGTIQTGWIPDTTAKKGKTYRYYVRCVRSTDGVPFSSFKNYLEIKY